MKIYLIQFEDSGIPEEPEILLDNNATIERIDTLAEKQNISEELEKEEWEEYVSELSEFRTFERDCFSVAINDDTTIRAWRKDL